MATFSSSFVRKAPTQERSRQTISAILEATARILVSEGYDKLNTNYVAEVAGVSVGSLYQYFESKENLVMALAESHVRKSIERFSTLAQGIASLPLAQATRQMIRALISASSHEGELNRVLFTEVVRLGEGLLNQLHGLAEKAVLTILEKHRDEIAPTNLEVASFILVGAIDSVILRANTIAKERIGVEALEEELYELVMRYLEPTS